METLFKDLKYGLRGLWKRKGFAAIAVLTLALGARARDVLVMVIRQGMSLVAIGVVLGVAGAFVLTRLMRSLLFEVGPTDSLTFVFVSLLLAAVGLIACYVPARRATKVDPLVALRYE